MHKGNEHQGYASTYPWCLLDGEPIEGVENFKHRGFVFITNGQGAAEITG